MQQKSVLILTGVLLLIGLYVFIFTRYLSPTSLPPSNTGVSPTPTTQPVVPYPNPTNNTQPAPGEQPSDAQPTTSIDDYIKAHIADFAPVKAQLGSSYTVTKVNTYAGEGVVTYGDGHTTYTADFTYSTDDFGAISVDSFVVRK